MAKQQKGKTQHKYFGINFPKLQQTAVLNPVVERATRSIIWHFSTFKDTPNPVSAPMNEQRPIGAVRATVQCGEYHNGFEEVFFDPALVSKLAMQGFNLRRILNTIQRTVEEQHDGTAVPLSWLEGTKHDLVVPIVTLPAVIEFAVRKEYDYQRIADAAEWKHNQLTKKGKA